MNASDKDQEMESAIAEALAAVDAIAPVDEAPSAAEAEALDNGQDGEPQAAASELETSELNDLVDAAIAATAVPVPADEAAAPEVEESEAERVARALDEMKSRHMRLMADFDNYRKRVQREQHSQRRFAGESALRELLDVVDNIERAVGSNREADVAGSMREGVIMILNQMLSVLERHGVKPFTSIGEVFAPERHEAVARHGHDKYEEDLVCEELQRGYMFHDRLLRPASVIVSAGKLDMSEDSSSSGSIKSEAEGLD
jgi:molecular chaperone GrpE